MKFDQFVSSIIENHRTVKYSALVLDDQSRNKLLNNKEVMNNVTDEHEVICHHMTIKMGGLVGTPHESRIGDKEDIIATHVGKTDDDNVIAVKVNGRSDNRTPHVTIAVNRQKGGKPVHSNTISDWILLNKSIQLSGTVEEIF